jgi:hypothetical protein
VKPTECFLKIVEEEREKGNITDGVDRVQSTVYISMEIS